MSSRLAPVNVAVLVAIGVACTSQPLPVESARGSEDGAGHQTLTSDIREPSPTSDEASVSVRTGAPHLSPRRAELVVKWRDELALVDFIETSAETFGVPDPDRIDLLTAREFTLGAQRYLSMTWAVVGREAVIAPREETAAGAVCRVQPFENNRDYGFALCRLGDDGLECRTRLAGRRVLRGADIECVDRDGDAVEPPPSVAASWPASQEDRACTTVEFDGDTVRFLALVVCETSEPTAEYSAQDVSIDELWETLTELNGMSPEIPATPR